MDRRKPFNICHQSDWPESSDFKPSTKDIAKGTLKQIERLTGVKLS